MAKLLLHSSTQRFSTNVRSIYLNCEDFKRHSFPNVLIEILSALFREIDRNILGWFGKGKKAKAIVNKILKKLSIFQRASDVVDEEVHEKTSKGGSTSVDGSAGVDIDK